MKTKIKLLLLLLVTSIITTRAQTNIDLLIINKKYDDAILEIDKELSIKPTSQLYLKKGIVYKNKQNYQQALTAFSNGLQNQPQSIRLLEETAECYAILGNNHDAVTYYIKATELDSNNLVIAGKLGRVYINLKEVKKAYEVFSSIYQQDSSNVYWNKQLAYCAFRTFNKKEAVKLYEMVIAQNPRDYNSYTNLIHAYNWKKEGSKIMETIAKGEKQFPNDAGLLYEKAMYLYKTKRYGPAMIHFEKYLKLEKEPVYETLMNLGISTYFAEQEEKALEIFSDLKRMNPNDPLVMYYQSLCYKKLKDFAQAEELMQFAIDASTPDYVSEMYHHLGQMYGQQRKFKESIAALEKSYKMNPGKTEVLFEIATTYEEYNSNKTLAMNYYRIYLIEAGESAKNAIYALERIEKLKEDLFFEE